MAVVADVATSETSGVLVPFAVTDLGVAIEFGLEVLLFAACGALAGDVAEAPEADGVGAAELSGGVSRAAAGNADVVGGIEVAEAVVFAVGG